MPLDRRPIEQMVADVGEEAFQRLARLFETETRDAMKEMRRLVGVQDWRELGRQAHSLKHSSASFGLAGLAEVAYGLERAADAAKADDAAALVTRLAAMIAGELEELSLALRTLHSYVPSPDLGGRNS
jgi:HPt (histidine-containing phosphotransfer) domain-containing protein